MLEKHLFWRLMLFYTQVAALVGIFSAVAFYYILKMMQNHRQSEFCTNLMFHESDPG